MIRELARISPDKKRAEKKDKRTEQNGEPIVICANPVHQKKQSILILAGTDRRAVRNGATSGRALPVLSAAVFISKNKPNEFDIGGGLNVFVPDDEIHNG